MSTASLEELNDALGHLHDLLIQNVKAEDAVAISSTGFDIRAELLKRKFEEKYGKPSNLYSPPISSVTVNRRMARARASNWAKMDSLAVGPPRSKETCGTMFGKDRAIPLGTIFRIEGEEWVMIGIDHSGITVSVKAIPVIENDSELLMLVSEKGAVPSLRGMDFDRTLATVRSAIVVKADEPVEQASFDAMPTEPCGKI